MRLIDADVLEKAIYKWMPKDQEAWMDSDIPPIENLVVSIMMTIEEQETIDAVPVIRCKECKHFDKDEFCHIWEVYRTNESYCDIAEREEE